MSAVHVKAVLKIGSVLVSGVQLTLEIIEIFRNRKTEPEST